MSTATRALLTFLATCSLAGAAHAQSSTTWTCWPHRDTQIACTVMASARAVDAARSAAPVRAVPAMGPAELVGAVRARPAALAGQLVYVPMHTVPFDDSPMQLLVEAVLCGAQAGCRAHYHASLAQVIRGEPEAFADMADPVLGGIL